MSRPVWEMVMEDMQSRDEFGRKKYNKPLVPFNGKNALREAYEELLDMCVYLRQAIYENENPSQK